MNSFSTLRHKLKCKSEQKKYREIQVFLYQIFVRPLLEVVERARRRNSEAKEHVSETRSESTKCLEQVLNYRIKNQKRKYSFFVQLRSTQNSVSKPSSYLLTLSLFIQALNSFHHFLSIILFFRSLVM